MERLSDKAIEIIDNLHTERLDYESEYFPLIDCANKCAAYEDTDLEPEEIERILDEYGRGLTLRTSVGERLEIVREIPLDRLRELAQADRDGRCVVLPCKAGDTVYSAFPLCGVSSHQIRKIEINADGSFACSALMIPFSDFGKTVFLAREEAEANLKERENNG